MTNDVRYYFKDLEAMFGKKPAYILVSSTLQNQDFDGKRVITVSVEMSGYDENNRIMFKMPGCPVPPCKTAHALDASLLR